MKIVATRVELLRAAAWCAAAVDTRGFNPLSAYFALAAAPEGGLVAFGFDGMTAARAMCAADVARPGTFGVRALDLLERLRAMPDGDVAISVDEAETASAAPRATISDAKRKRRFSLMAIHGSDLSWTPPAGDDGKPVEIDGEALAEALAAVAYAQHSNLEGKWPGPQITLAPPVLRVEAATQGGRAIHAVTVDGLDASGSVMLGPKTASAVRKLAGAGGPVNMRLSRARFVLEVGPCVMYAPVMSLELPALELFKLRFDSEARAHVDKTALVSGLRAVAQASADEYRSVTLTSADGRVVLDAGARSDMATDEIEASRADPFVARLPLSDLRSAIDAIESETIEIGCSGAGSPVIVQPAEQPAGRLMRHVIMPIVMVAR